MPAYAEDLLAGGALELRKKSDKPVVGFCGWADFKNLKNALGYLIGNALIDVQKLLSGKPNLEVRKKGLYFRKRALSVLKNSALIRPNFIIRSSYSGHRETISVDPAAARSEFIGNILASDFTLCVKGDGNYSLRFYEALSLGRVPLLIDTDCVLPLEHILDYSDFIVRVDYRDLAGCDQILGDYYQHLTPEKFEMMQAKARETFEKYLCVGSFLKYAVEKLL
jgi:hypothetical protein